ncbi:hypothetical protein LC613_01260 [Nostoc sphaeroides CHAB 2801]|uniref:hypothetical protein n=1 Tax=Nostoc sphaeroides TaxID=446679 RepID=UPI001E4E96C8|nr:hypothetical protein [Nostoc sphaeroides]MCC5626891.1 hypothetical protein [Nostoc sphaeroides CHAB 2801]
MESPFLSILTLVAVVLLVVVTGGIGYLTVADWRDIAVAEMMTNAPAAAPLPSGDNFLVVEESFCRDTILSCPYTIFDGIPRKELLPLRSQRES